MIAKLDRFSRNAAFILALRDSGVRFVAVDMPEANDLTVGIMPDEASDEERAVAFAKSLARRAVLAWDGIGNADGDAIDPSPEAIDALLDVWPIFEAFQLTYVSKGLLLEQEKNASALSPSGPSAGASDTAKPARKPGR